MDEKNYEFHFITRLYRTGYYMWCKQSILKKKFKKVKEPFLVPLCCC